MKSVLNSISKYVVKNAPRICVEIGVVGVITGVVIACKDTKASAKELDEGKELLIVSKNYAETKKETAVAYWKYVKMLIKVYWPSAVVIGGSVFVIVFGHKILLKRYLAVVSAYEVLDKQYRSYRSKVIEKYGKDEDISLAHGLVKDEETGVYLPEDPDSFIPDRDLSDYAIFWGPGYSIMASDNFEDNYEMLRDIERAANDLFDRRGFVYLNDVYSMLGSDRVETRGIGWVKGRGDDYVSFGIIDANNARALDHSEGVYLLDFNHDGLIAPYL